MVIHSGTADIVIRSSPRPTIVKVQRRSVDVGRSVARLRAHDHGIVHSIHGEVGVRGAFDFRFGGESHLVIVGVPQHIPRRSGLFVVVVCGGVVIVVVVVGGGGVVADVVVIVIDVVVGAAVIIVVAVIVVIAVGAVAVVAVAVAVVSLFSGVSRDCLALGGSSHGLHLRRKRVQTPLRVRVAAFTAVGRKAIGGAVTTTVAFGRVNGDDTSSIIAHLDCGAIALAAVDPARNIAAHGVAVIAHAAADAAFSIVFPAVDVNNGKPAAGHANTITPDVALCGSNVHVGIA